MVLQELLQLDKTQSSIRKIDFFLGTQVKLSEEYNKALVYKAEILHHIGKTNDALKILFSAVLDFKDMDNEGIILICDGIIDLCLDIKRYDQVLKYIQVKKNYLPVSLSQLHIKDNIKYYLSAKMLDEAKNELQKYLTDDLTKEESIFAKEELSKLYYLEHQYDKYLEIIPELEGYYQANLAIAKLADLGLNKIKISFEKGNYLKAIIDGNNYLKDESLTVHHKLACATILIKCYLLSNDYKRASIIESEYCDLVTKENKEDSLPFCLAALELYTKTNTLISINEYQNKIRELEAQRKEEKISKKKTSKNVEEIIVPVIQEEEEIIAPTNEPLLTVEEEKTIHRQMVKPKYEAIQNVIVSSAYEKLEEVFNSISELDLKVKFREIFRTTCIKLCEVFNIDEVYLLYHKRRYLGIHYKKERAYDKRLEFEDINNTLSFAAMNYDSEAFLSPEDYTYIKNIVTGKPYDNSPYGLAIPLVDSLKTIGSIAFIANDEFLNKEMVYEALKLISSMLNTRLLMSLWQEDVEFNNKKLFFINENMSSGLKEEIDGYLHFSSECCKILGVLENMTEEDYFSKMKTEDIIEYRRIHEELYTLLSEGTELEYSFKKDDKWIKIKERYYPMVYDGVICILSLIDDMTEIEANKKALIDLAYTNPISKLNTEVKLMVDLAKIYESRKLSLAVIDIIDFNLYRELYGYNFTNQLIYTVGGEIVKSFENDFDVNIYHLEVDRYVVLFKNINDKRLIDSKLHSCFRRVSANLLSLNSRVKLSFNAGVYRLQRHANIDEPSKILYYALDALADAKNINDIGNHIAHFDSDLHKQKFNENHLITHISESIDHAKLGLTYKQIVNINNNEVHAYNIVLNLDNYEIDYSYMDYVVKRRGLTTQLEKYAISNIFKELKMLKESIKGYVLCFIRLSKSTLEENFISFINTQQAFFKVPKENVVLWVDNANNMVCEALRAEGYIVASNNLLDVYSNSCDYLMFDYHLTNGKSIEQIVSLCKEHNIVCIFNNIDNKEDLEFVKENSQELIYGQYYKKAIRVKGLIERLKN